jgi:uncharacterized protein
MKPRMPYPQPERLTQISRGLSESASDTPGQQFQNGQHPEGVRELSNFAARLLHPFRVLNLFLKLTRGIATLNPRLISCAPSACLCVFALLLEFSALSSDKSPFAKVEPLAPGEARWTTGFWADRFELCRTQMIPGMERLMAGTNYTQFLQNFRIAAGLAEGKSRGASFNDGDFYKWIEGACATLAVRRDSQLEKTIEEAIEVIAQAQRADGYLHTPVLIRARNGDTNAVAFQDRQNFEMYNMGHLFTAACVHHRITGRTNLLAVAVRAADFLSATFSNATPDAARSSVCPSHYMGIIDLYRETHDAKYLELAKRFFDLRSGISDGGDDNQDRIPFDQQTQAVGHAVRANYLYAGAADLFLETGDAKIWGPLGPIWTNLVGQKMYITGGCGALYDGASPDGSKDQKSITRVHQAYGRNYQLPNVTAHSETCANIGNVLWNWRMFLATGEARFVDVMELALYNSVLSGASLDGTNFFYTNPLRVTDPLPNALRWPRTRVPFLSSFCCPPNLVRTIAESSGYAYARSSGTVWVNLYGSSTVRTEGADGQILRLTQDTEYPWSGRVRIRIDECGDREFALNLRIPGWANGASVKINHAAVELSPSPAGYFEIRRAWRSGDVVDLDLPMPVRLMEANPLVEEDLNQLAFQRGPVVYCLESADLPRGTRLNDVVIPAGFKPAARYDARLLDGVAVLEGTAAVQSSGDWSGQLYREAHVAELRPLPIRLIPYFAWGNRGVSEMTVWLPRAGW